MILTRLITCLLLSTTCNHMPTPDLSYDLIYAIRYLIYTICLPLYTICLPLCSICSPLCSICSPLCLSFLSFLSCIYIPTESSRISIAPYDVTLLIVISHSISIPTYAKIYALFAIRYISLLSFLYLPIGRYVIMHHMLAYQPLSMLTHSLTYLVS